MMRRAAKFTCVALLLWLVSATNATAQSGMTGTVRDTSGAVLPGVTVEAASEALIEKVKSAVTDSNGVYRIVELRPGTYAVTFTLPGFQTVRQENIPLASEFTATINVELRVGELAETIVVTGEAPVVDTTTAVHTQVLNRDAIDYLPSGRMMQSIAQLVPGINLNLPDVGGARAMQQTYMSTHGMSAANNTVLVDGMTVNGLQLDGAVQAYVNESMNQEMSYQTSGISAETSAGGVRLNMIPREGGNRFSGDLRYSLRPGGLQASNLTDRHLTVGLQAGNAIDRIMDVTASQGGPVFRNKLWFFTTARYNTVDTKIANTFFDDGSQGVDDQYIRQALLRLTWQMSANNKLSAYFDEIDKYRGHDMQSNEDPEEAALQWFSPAYHTAQVKWSSTLTSKLLAEAGWSSNLEYYTNSYRPGVGKARFTPEWFASASRLESLQNGRRMAATAENTQSPERQNLQASLSYVTGSHTMKFGAQYQWGDFLHTVDANADLTQQYRSPVGQPRFSVPDSVIVRNTPLVYGERLNRDFGVYAQDSWKIRRLTLNYGIRWENVVAQVLPGESPAGRWAPARSFAEIKDVPNWKDWAPRFAMVYDLFGSGRTALKYSLNRYNQSRTTGIAATYNPLASLTSTSLPWRDINGDDIAQGFRNFNPDGTVSNCTYLTPGCEIDLSGLAANFGVAALNEYGAYPRTWNLESALEVQHEILRGLSGTLSWFRGNFHNLTTTVNRSYSLGDYAPYTVYNPLTGEPIEVFARTVPTRPTRNLDTYDPERKQNYESFNVDFNARPGRGITLFGGVAVERETNINCTAPDDPNTFRFCNDDEVGIPYRKSFKLSGTVPLPWGINASAVVQSNQGTTSSRTLVATRGSTAYPSTCPSPCPAGQVILPTTVFGQTSLTVALEDPSTVFTERINQLDLRFGRTFAFGRARVTPSLEIFNVNNSDAVISYASTNALNFGSSYLRPNSIMQPRMVGVTVLTRW